MVPICLGELIRQLDRLDPETPIQGVSTNIASYRGYYCDLAISPGDGATALHLSMALAACIGKEFEGYKGGTYTMNRGTDMWLAEWGDCGVAIVGVSDDGTLLTETDE